MLSETFGAKPGLVWVCDGDQTIILSPERARDLASRLPQLAEWAEVLSRSNACEPSAEDIGEMAAQLHAANWKWFPKTRNRQRGFWGLYNESSSRFIKTETVDYKTATMQANELNELNALHALHALHALKAHHAEYRP